jgi:hypothetical protein
MILQYGKLLIFKLVWKLLNLKIIRPLDMKNLFLKALQKQSEDVKCV